jgi:hypothetical protein
VDSCLLGTCKGRAPEFPSLRASFPSVPFVRLARAVALSGPFLLRLFLIIKKVT